MKNIHFLHWQFNPEDGHLTNEHTQLRLTKLQAKLLEYLLKNSQKLLSREQLISYLWENKVVNEDALSRNIAQLRNSLGDNSKAPIYIETIPKRGYRFIAPVIKQAENYQASQDDIEPNKKVRNSFIVNKANIVLAIAALVICLSYYLLYSTKAIDWQDAINNASRLTADAAVEFQPEISSDGRLICYSYDDNGQYAVVVKTSDKQVKHLIRDELTHFISPALSPDNKQLLVAAYKNEDCEIRLFDLPELISRSISSCMMVNMSGIFDWSSDGTKFLFVDASGENNQTAIWQFDTETRQKTQVTFPAQASEFDTRPRYSNRNHEISFTRGTDSVRNIYSVKIGAKESDIRQLTNEHAMILGFDWFADGKQLIFDSNKRGDKNLWLLNLSTDKLTNLGAKDGQLPSLSDNHALLFQEKRYQANLWQKNLSDNSREKIISSAKFDNNPSFSPDGKQLAFITNRHGISELWFYDTTNKTSRSVLSIEKEHLIAPHWSNDGDSLLITSFSEYGYQCLYFDVKQNMTRRIPTAKPVSQCSYKNDGKIVAISKVSGELSQLVSVSTQGEISAITSDGAATLRTLDNGNVIFTKPNQDGLFLLDNDNNISNIIPEMSDNYQNQLATVGKFIYYLDKRNNHLAIWRYNVDSNAKEYVTDFVPSAVGRSLTVSPDHKQIVVSKLDRVDSDLYIGKAEN